jgi:hypothetical protein
MPFAPATNLAFGGPRQPHDLHQSDIGTILSARAPIPDNALYSHHE